MVGRDDEIRHLSQVCAGRIEDEDVRVGLVSGLRDFASGRDKPAIPGPHRNLCCDHIHWDPLFAAAIGIGDEDIEPAKHVRPVVDDRLLRERWAGSRRPRQQHGRQHHRCHAHSTHDRG